MKNSWLVIQRNIFTHLCIQKRVKEHLITSRPCADSWKCVYEEETHRTFLLKLRGPILKVHLLSILNNYPLELHFLHRLYSSCCFITLKKIF